MQFLGSLLMVDNSHAARYVFPCIMQSTGHYC